MGFDAADIVVAEGALDLIEMGERGGGARESLVCELMYSVCGDAFLALPLHGRWVDVRAEGRVQPLRGARREGPAHAFPVCGIGALHLLHGRW